MPELHATSLVHRLGRSFGIILAALLVLTAVPGYSPKALQHTASAAENLAQLPLSFVPNAGQTNPAVRFTVQSPAGRFFFTPTTVVLALTAPRLPDPPDPADPLATPERPDPPSALRLRFMDARPGTSLAGARELPGTANYLTGSDPAQWRSRLPTYAAIVYEQLYNGIDLRYEGGEGRLKSTYLVAAGADPGRIRWRWDSSLGGTDDAFVAKLSAKLDDLTYSTYLGGSSVDWGYGIAMDTDGAAYVAGTTQSNGFLPNPLYGFSAGPDDAFVIKLSSAGSPVYSTFLGGSAHDSGWGIAAIARSLQLPPC